MSDQDRFEEYLATLRARVNEQAAGSDEDDSGVAPVITREEAFTTVVLETLEDLGQIAGVELCSFERRLGRAIGRVNGWYVDDEGGQVDLFTTVHRGADRPTSVTATELTQAIRRAAHVFMEARNGVHASMEPASASYDMMQRLHEVWPTIDRLRVVVLADGLAANVGISDMDSGGPELQVDIWDLRRLYRAASSGLPYEPTQIDIVQRLGAALPCLPMPDSSADYACYLAVIPGGLLHNLYHEFGARLLELNVRSFLQARGKVNQGIRDTLKSEPARFLAYNNGISATAEHIDVTRGDDGTLGITSITGLQVVNGGQTVASIHRAREHDRVDLSDVHVQAKITIVRPEHIETLVPLVSRYANTQNRVNEADFSANHPFHVRIQQLSQNVWVPGEQSRWFYERARGQYQVARAREGDTPARLRRFDATTPKNQKFDKVDLARFMNSWDQLPHMVSRGGQKNFIQFMDRMARIHGTGWEPDPEYYRRLIAVALVYRRAERIARMHAFPSYRANAVTYTIALTAYRTAGRIDLEQIWNQQEVSTALADTMEEWMPIVHEQIVESAGSRNVTEWCKREECWHHLQTADVAVPGPLERELSVGQPLPTVGDPTERRGANLTADDRENIARVIQVTSAEWVHISGWGARTGALASWQVGIATTLATYAASGWLKVPSRKQANQGVEILKIATDRGGRLDGLVED